MSNQIIDLAWLTETTPTQKLILISLADHANDDGKCFPSVSRISERTGACESAVRKSISALEKMGHISRTYQTGKPTFYTIHPCTKHTPVPNTPLYQSTETPVPRSETPVPRSETPVPKHNITVSNHNITVIEPSLKKQVIDADYLVAAFGVDKQIANDWIYVRKHKKAAPLSDTALRMLLSESNKAGITPAQAIANAAGSGWISFKASYMNGYNNKQTNTAASAAGSDQW